jgi:predicted dehydrogenase
VGSAGQIFGNRPNVLQVLSGPEMTPESVETADAFELELAAYVDALGRGDPPPVSAEAGLMAQTVIDAAKLAASRGDAVEITVQDGARSN